MGGRERGGLAGRRLLRSRVSESRGHVDRGRAWLLFLLVLAGGAALRLVQLDRRPMHADEAVQAVKFGDLLEHGRYVYDPSEYHGPALNYLTLPAGRISGDRRLSEVSETVVRCVPAAAGILLIALVWLLRAQLGTAAALIAAALTAASPALVFYSRYYIHETLLAAGTLAAIAALWQVVPAMQLECPGRRGRILLPIALGFALGMMHATKETCAIAFLAIGLAACLTLSGLVRRVPRRRLLSGVSLAVATAAAVSVLLYSSFFQNPQGVLDSLSTYGQYLPRAAGQGSAGSHIHPWYQYLQWLFWSPGGARPGNEAVIAVLALPALIAAAIGRGLERRQLPWVRFLSVYTLVMLLVYSALPYKTPWCAVGPLHGLILLAGTGAAMLLRLPLRPVSRTVVAGLIAAAVAQLGWQAYTTSFVDFDSPHNPYVYAHPRRDVIQLAQRVHEIAQAHPDRLDMHIQVIAVQGDYWPLPWYLRRFPRVGWFDEQLSGPPAPLIVASPQLEPQILEYLYVQQPPGQRPLYISLSDQPDEPHHELRPGEPLRIYVERDLWLTACAE